MCRQFTLYLARRWSGSKCVQHNKRTIDVKVPFRSGFLSTLVRLSLLTTSFIRFSTLTVRTWTHNQVNQNEANKIFPWESKISHAHIYSGSTRDSQLYCCGNQLGQHPLMEFSLSWPMEYKQHQCYSLYSLPCTTYHHQIQRVQSRICRLKKRNSENYKITCQFICNYVHSNTFSILNIFQTYTRS